MNKKKRKVLVIVDMQNYFVDGMPESDMAKKVSNCIVKKLKNNGKEYSSIILTKIHRYNKYEDVLNGNDYNEEGYKIADDIYNEIKNLKKSGVKVKIIRKYTLISNKLIEYLKAINTIFGNFDIDIVGVYTDICVISNALAIRSAFPNVNIFVDSKCCAGTSINNHNAALHVMNSCKIETRKNIKIVNNK